MNPWLGVWEAARKFADGKSVGVSVPLGSGYNVDEEKAARVAYLKKRCEDAVTRKDWEPREGKTFCNIAAAWIANEYGCGGLSGLLANAQAEYLLNDVDGWEALDTDSAIRHSKAGALVFAVKQYDDHGHIATCYPISHSWSGSWNKNIPMVANVGRVNGIMPCSQAFPVREGEPRYYLLRSSKHGA